MTRLHCAVPFCRRTTGRFPTSNEWICIDHWRLVDRGLKLLRTKLRRRWDREIAILEFATSQASALVQAHPIAGLIDPVRDALIDAEYAAIDRAARARRARRRMQRAIWRRMKAQAIERAVGI